MEHPEEHGQAEDGTLAAVPSGPALADSDFVTGTVSEWHHEEGWGVVEAPEVPGGCWTHFTAIAGPGYRELTVGELVRVAAEPVEQDGFAYRALAVLRAGMTTADIPDPTLEPSASPAYSSTSPSASTTVA